MIFLPSIAKVISAIKEFTWLIDKISEIGMDKVVVHPTHTPEPFDQSERPGKIKHAKECLDYLAEYGHKKGVQIALEDLPRTCLGNRIEEDIDLLSANDKLKVCFDLNHSLIDDTVEFIKAVGNRIITTHVSDRDNINERHWLPGEGVLDWKSVVDAFTSIGYNGAWIYEIGLEAPPTINRRRFTYLDFVTNAKQIFAKEDLTVIGTPYPNLGLWGPKNMKNKYKTPNRAGCPFGSFNIFLLPEISCVFAGDFFKIF